MFSSKKLLLLGFILTSLALPGCGKKCHDKGPKSKTELSKKQEKKHKKNKKEKKSKKEDRSKKSFFSK